MNEMDELSRFRARVPDRGTARAEEIFRTALAEELSSERHSASPPRHRLRKRWPAWRLVIAVPLALGLAAGVTVAVLPSSPPVLTAQLLADRAAAAALNSPATSAGQWVYERLEDYHPALGLRGFPNPSFQDGWMTADGTLSYGAGSIGDPIFPYDKLDSLPRDPAAFNAYFVNQDPAKTDNHSVVDFSQIMQMLFGMILPPWLEAEMYHALALIPDVQVKDHVKDIAGRAGVAFVLPPTKQSEQLEIILDSSDYHLLARGSWGDPSKPATLNETAILTTVLVAGLGSTQPSTASPSAPELAAEQITRASQYFRMPPVFTTPGQWLYRDLHSGGKDQEIWATSDDSEQAAYVNGTLQVCKRTDPCAAAEQWLMPAGPSYSLVFPPYPRSGSGAIRNSKLFPPGKAGKVPVVKPLPTLPAYPGPLLDKLNTYSTGCSQVPGDCNAVTVTANVLTGYGNNPGSATNWYLALADVPGVSVQHITDPAGKQDIELMFPFSGGITGILLNASTLHYAGYVRDGEPTLVLNQALVSGPGVRP